MSSPGSRKLRARSDKTKAETKFEKLRRLRATGESAIALLPSDNDDSDDQIYMKVDEDEYRTSSKYASDRLDDFVVDDDDGSYADTIADDIGGETSAVTYKKQSKLQKPKASKAPSHEKSQAAAVAKQGVSKEKRSLSAMFKNAHLRTPKKPSVANQDDEEFMASLISGLEAPTTPSKSSAKRRHQQTPDTTSYSARRRAAASKGKVVVGQTPRAAAKPVGLVDITDPSLDPFAPQATPQRPLKKQRQDAMDVGDDPFAASDAEEPRRQRGLETEDEVRIKTEPADLADDLAALDQINDDELLGGLETLDTSADAKPAAPKLLYAAEDSEPQGADWTAVQQDMAAQSQLLKPEPAPAEAPAVVANGGQPTDVCMYWLDANETNGNVYLFGKLI
ncbi:hypothetical protein LPJ75_006220, partial [Coemansia sp. RSA 2598]